MKRFREESRASNNGRSSLTLDEAPFKPLNLRLTKNQEFSKKIETRLQQDYPPNPPENFEKLKSLNFPIKEIRIGDWNRVAINPDDLRAKFYFKKKKLMWESLDFVETETANTMARLKRKIEIQWSDVLSFEASYHPHDETGTLKVELKKRPKFFIEINPQPGKHTQWQQMDKDFTTNLYASTNRRHTLQFGPGVLQKNLDKLVSSHSFWSKLVKVRFPTLETPYFDIGYGNSNSNDSMDSSCYSHGQTLSFNVNNNIHRHSQEVNFNMETEFCSTYEKQINSSVQGYSQNNNVDQLLAIQVIQPSSQLITEHLIGSQLNNSMFLDMSQMINTGELHGNGIQEYANPSIQGYGYVEVERNTGKLLGTQTNSMMFQHMNKPLMYPQFGPCVQEGERQKMEHTQIASNFQINYNQHMDFNQFGDFDHDQYISSMFPPIDIEYVFNSEANYSDSSVYH